MPDTLFGADFQQIYSNTTNVFPSPEDWRDCPIYFLMVDRFNNTKRSPFHTPFDDQSLYKYQGGSFEGVLAQLKYIVGLGARAIWLSPVLKNRINDEGCYHGYGIHDFLHANPRFASDPKKADDELRTLVDAAHQAGLYVILDIVLNHTGDIFGYGGSASEANYSPTPLPIAWRDTTGTARGDWPVIEDIQPPRPSDALVWPKELQFNDCFRRQGGSAPGGDDTIGDFASLKQIRTDFLGVQNALIRAYQYVIARFDVDGFRIDTLRYLKDGLPLTFGNAIREYALSIGKKNFFTFGEIWTSDSEDAIANFIGRNTTVAGDQVGVDAALDYPLFNTLKPIVKGFSSPSSLVGMYNKRKQTEEYVISSHGDATRFFVTFLDNHDVKERLRHWDPTQQPSLDDEITLGLACLAALPGIICVYYGTEQGLHGAGSDPAVREALWGGPGFSTDGSFYKQVAQILSIRGLEPALRYGRFYFRQLSGDGANFGFSSFSPGVLAFSRILNDREVIIIANFSKTSSEHLYVAVDNTLSQAGTNLKILYSNKSFSTSPAQTKWLPGASVAQVDGAISQGVCATRVTLAAAEVQILG
jgi:glycosidase